jgi:hypothetical protein
LAGTVAWSINSGADHFNGPLAAAASAFHDDAQASQQHPHAIIASAAVRTPHRFLAPTIVQPPVQRAVCPTVARPYRSRAGCTNPTRLRIRTLLGLMIVVRYLWGEA